MVTAAVTASSTVAVTVTVTIVVTVTLTVAVTVLIMGRSFCRDGSQALTLTLINPNYDLNLVLVEQLQFPNHILNPNNLNPDPDPNPKVSSPTRRHPQFTRFSFESREVV